MLKKFLPKNLTKRKKDLFVEYSSVIRTGDFKLGKYESKTYSFYMPQNANGDSSSPHRDVCHALSDSLALYFHEFYGLKATALVRPDKSVDYILSKISKKLNGHDRFNYGGFTSSRAGHALWKQKLWDGQWLHRLSISDIALMNIIHFIYAKPDGTSRTYFGLLVARNRETFTLQNGGRFRQFRLDRVVRLTGVASHVQKFSLTFFSYVVYSPAVQVNSRDFKQELMHHYDPERYKIEKVYGMHDF